MDRAWRTTTRQSAGLLARACGPCDDWDLDVRWHASLASGRAETADVPCWQDCGESARSGQRRCLSTTETSQAAIRFSPFPAFFRLSPGVCLGRIVGVETPFAGEGRGCGRAAGYVRGSTAQAAHPGPAHPGGAGGGIGGPPAVDQRSRTRRGRVTSAGNDPAAGRRAEPGRAGQDPVRRRLARSMG